jgi:hypothetical protein
VKLNLNHKLNLKHSVKSYKPTNQSTQKSKMKNSSQTPPNTKAHTLTTKQVMASTLIANLSTRISTNIFEIASTRIIKDLVFCRPKTCLSPANVAECPQCLPSRNIFKVIHHMVKKNGPSIALNGLAQGIGTGLSRTLSFFPTYEYCKYFGRKKDRLEGS